MNIFFQIILSSTLLCLFISCGQNKGKSKSDPRLQTEDEHEREVEGETGTTTTTSTTATDGSNIDGHYLATFSTLNPHVNGTLPGSASFHRKEETLYIFVRLFAGAPKVWHQQKVYTGTRCPTLEDDKNGDGYIDIIEAEAVLGKILIPLDANPAAQYSGSNFYPVGDLGGSYHYERLVNFKRFLNDLRSDDRDPEDSIVKLAVDEPFILEGKPVLIQGTDDKVEYPETVATIGRRRPFQSLPIACGTFKKVSTTPGVPDDEVIPGPIADVEEGQDRPAPDEPTNEDTDTDGPERGGGSNETSSGETRTSDEDGNTLNGRRTTDNSNSRNTRSSSTDSGSNRTTTNRNAEPNSTTSDTNRDSSSSSTSSTPDDDSNDENSSTDRNPELDPEPTIET